MSNSQEFALQVKGFILSKVLMAPLELDIFTLLESGGLPFEDINSAAFKVILGKELKK